MIVNAPPTPADPQGPPPPALVLVRVRALSLHVYVCWVDRVAVCCVHSFAGEIGIITVVTHPLSVTKQLTQQVCLTAAVWRFFLYLPVQSVCVESEGG